MEPLLASGTFSQMVNNLQEQMKKQETSVLQFLDALRERNVPQRIFRMANTALEELQASYEELYRLMQGTGVFPPQQPISASMLQEHTRKRLAIAEPAVFDPSLLDETAMRTIIAKLSPEDLKKHMDSFLRNNALHFIQSEILPAKYTCPTCQKPLRSDTELYLHLLAEHTDEMERICLQSAVSISSYRHLIDTNTRTASECIEQVVLPQLPLHVLSDEFMCSIGRTPPDTPADAAETYSTNKRTKHR